MTIRFPILKPKTKDLWLGSPTERTVRLRSTKLSSLGASLLAAVIVASGCSDAPSATGAARTERVLPRQLSGTLDLPVLFKVDNAPLGRPQVGLQHASILFETKVEGHVTRLAALIDVLDGTVVGPVRSGRVSDLAILGLLGRVGYAYAGANLTAYSILQTRNGFVDLNFGEQTISSMYSRMPGRPQTYNLFFKSDSRRLTPLLTPLDLTMRLPFAKNPSNRTVPDMRIGPAAMCIQYRTKFPSLFPQPSQSATVERATHVRYSLGRNGTISRTQDGTLFETDSGPLVADVVVVWPALYERSDQVDRSGAIVPTLQLADADGFMLDKDGLRSVHIELATRGDGFLIREPTTMTEIQIDVRSRVHILFPESDEVEAPC